MHHPKSKLLLLICAIVTLTLAASFPRDQPGLAWSMQPSSHESDKGKLTIEHSFNSGVDARNISQNSLVNITQKSRDPLETYIAILKSFILVNHFAVEKFEENAPSLEMHFEKIIRAGEATNDKGIVEQIDFARSMFEEMVDAIELLKYYDLTGNMAFHLVHCMIDLNIRLLTLFDSKGLPDPLIPGYAFKVTRFSELAYYWDQEFYHQSGVSYGVKSLFRKYSAKATKTLARLVIHI